MTLMADESFVSRVTSHGRDTVRDFVEDGPASAERMLGIEACAELTDMLPSLGVTLSSQVDGSGRCSGVGVWYEVYRRWFAERYTDGSAVSRYVFARSVRDLLGLGSRPNGHRAIGRSGRRDVQYRVFCYRGRAMSRVSQAGAQVTSSPIDADPGPATVVCAASDYVMSNRDFLSYEARRREIEDFFHFAQGRSVSMCEALSHIFIDRAQRFGISGSMRMWDWCVEHGLGGTGWHRRKLPRGRYVLDIGAPAKGLPIPPCDGNDLVDESFVRFSFLLRTPEADHPDACGWDEEVADGAVFGRHCLLSVGVTLIEPVINPIDGTRHMREVYVDNPGILEMSPTGFSFDSDTLLAILGDQSDVRRLIDEMEACEVECVGGAVGHSAASAWLDGEPHSMSAMVFDERVSCHNAAFVPYGRAYGRFGSAITTPCVVIGGAYAAKMAEASDEDYPGYILGDEFSGETGERTDDHDTAHPVAYVDASSWGSTSHPIPMSSFTR